jgi:hypothetical protein
LTDFQVGKKAKTDCIIEICVEEYCIKKMKENELGSLYHCFFTLTDCKVGFLSFFLEADTASTNFQDCQSGMLGKNKCLK